MSELSRCERCKNVVCICKNAEIIPFPPSKKFRDELIALIEKYGGKSTDDVIGDLRYALNFFEAKRITGK